MPRFFCETPLENQIVIVGEDALHIKKVLRMKVGEKLTVHCVDGNDYDCVISQMTQTEIYLDIVNQYPNTSEPSVKVTLYQALPKKDKMEWIIQKAVELGVYQIVPVLTKRCVSRPDEKSMQKKIVRYQKIAQEAAKQSGRGMIPTIGQLMTFEEAIEHMQQCQKKILCYEKGGKRLNEIIDLKDQSIGILIGSEGGFEQTEVELATAEQVQIATLGKLILRCETAPLTALSIMMNITENI